ncbi:MAG: sulfatase [Verrucomicrobiales bacterium]|nr:sulfatase [Verrucomicrobiales bacterium]
MTFRLIFLLFLILVSPGLTGHAENRANVIFILADDLGWSDTTLYGQTEFYQTPNLERLAARGMKFTRAYTASPLCSPTRCSILTGLNPARTGLTTPNCHQPKINLIAQVAKTAKPNLKLLPVSPVTRLDPKYYTLGEALRDAGFATAHFGKWHLGAEPYSPLENGFEVDIPHWHGPGPAGSFVAPWKYPDFKEKSPGEHIEDRLGDEISHWIESHIRKNPDQPFFVNYWQFSVHAPFDAKAGLIEKHRKRVEPEDGQRSPTYAAMVESLDDNVGRVLDTVDRVGLTENTAIIFFSDNGGNMYNEVDGTTPTDNRPLRGGKGNNWDGGTRVPAIVAWPGKTEPGSVSDTLLGSSDFYPTILDLLGLKPAEGQLFDGDSLAKVLEGNKDPALKSRAIFSHFPHSTGVPDTLPPSITMHRENWKLIRLFHHSPDQSHEHRLFNLENDIREKSNVAEKNPDVLKSMIADLDQFLADTKAVFPTPNPAYRPEIPGGWSSSKDCNLRTDDGSLQASSTGNDPHFHTQLGKKPIPPGEVKVRVRIKTTGKGNLEIRWQEKGVAPSFHRDRMVGIPLPSGNDWEVLEFKFNPEKSVTAIRFDPGNSPGKTRFDSIQIFVDGKAAREWDFNDSASQ